MRRFWIQFELDLAITSPGFGVTALDPEDALHLLEQHVFPRGLPRIAKFVEDVAVPALDQRHVVPNIGNIFVRGIWFPTGLTSQSESNW